jgi:hypothetical protein
MPGVHYARGKELVSDLERLERDLVGEILRSKALIDIDKQCVFEFKADISSGLLNDLDDFVSRVP